MILVTILKSRKRRSKKNFDINSVTSISRLVSTSEIRLMNFLPGNVRVCATNFILRKRHSRNEITTRWFSSHYYRASRRRVTVRSNSASDYCLFQWFRHLYRRRGTRRGTVNATDDVELMFTLTTKYTFILMEICYRTLLLRNLYTGRKCADPRIDYLVFLLSSYCLLLLLLISGAGKSDAMPVFLRWHPLRSF